MFGWFWFRSCNDCRMVDRLSLSIHHSKGGWLGMERRPFESDQLYPDGIPIRRFQSSINGLQYSKWHWISTWLWGYLVNAERQNQWTNTIERLKFINLESCHLFDTKSWYGSSSTLTYFSSVLFWFATQYIDYDKFNYHSNLENYARKTIIYSLEGIKMYIYCKCFVY